VIRDVGHFVGIHRKTIMLPGLRLVLAAITATILLVVLGFVQLVKLHVAQDHSSNFAPVEARFAGLAFAARADWTPVPTFRTRSLESLAPFANLPPIDLPADEDISDTEVPAQIIVLVRTHAEPARPAEERASPSVMTDVGPPAAPEADGSAEAAWEAADPPELMPAALPLSAGEATASPAVPATPELVLAAAPLPVEPISEPALATATALPPRVPETVVAAVTAGVPLPAARPASAPPRGAQPTPAQKKAAVPRPRPPATPARPPASTAPTNPFSALFGG
jgi:hypothetical protein